MTFYYHFSDIYDLIEWICLEDTAKILDGKKTYNTWQEGFLNIFHAVQENRPFIMNVYHSISRDAIETHLYKLTYNLLFDVVNEKSTGMTVPDSDKQFIADFYKYAFVGMLLDWIKRGMKEPPEEMIDRIGILIHGEFSRALEQFRID